MIDTEAFKKHIKGHVTFEHYRDGDLWYETDSGFKFPVPTSDTGSAIFQAKDKASFFGRWIRKHMELRASGPCQSCLVHSDCCGQPCGKCGRLN